MLLPVDTMTVSLAELAWPVRLRLAKSAMSWTGTATTLAPIGMGRIRRRVDVATGRHHDRIIGRIGLARQAQVGQVCDVLDGDGHDVGTDRNGPDSTPRRCCYRSTP